MKEFIEKLIGRLEDRIKYNELCHEEFPNAKMSLTYEVQINAYKNAISIVNQLAEEYINCSTNTSRGWIPCSERLPERTKPIQTEEYTVTMRKITRVGKCSPFSSHASFDYESGKWLVKGFEVIAWQPLPPAYVPKEGRE